MTEICTIRIEMDGASYGGEDVVKDMWPHFVPWLTRRHGVETGEISLDVTGRYPDEKSKVRVFWKYETTGEDAPSDEQD